MVRYFLVMARQGAPGGLGEQDGQGGKQEKI